MKKILPLLSFVLLFAGPGRAQLLYEHSYKPNPQVNYITNSAPDGQGNILFSGINLIGFSRYKHTLLLVKPNTDTLWTRKNPVQLEREFMDLKPLPGGGFVFGGNIKNGNTIAIMLQKLNASGFPVMTKTYTSAPSAVISLLTLPDKGYIMGGGYGSVNYSFIRTDSSGNIIWNKDYSWATGITGIDGIVDMKFTADGNIITIGVVNKPVGPWHPKLLLVNRNGDSLAGRQLIVNGFNRKEWLDYNRNGITSLSDGGFLFTAQVDTTGNPSFPNGSEMAMAVKVDANLNMVWKYVHRLPGNEEYMFTKSRELADGSVLVLGFKYRAYGNFFSIFRLSPFGTLMNTYTFPSTTCNEVWANTLDVLNDSTFMVGGQCGNSAGLGMYVATVKIPNLPAVLPLITAAKPELALQPTALGQSYPNPAQEQAIVPYTLPNSTRSAKILLMDITGRQVGSYHLKVQQKQGSVPVNLSRLRNGLYLYSLVIDGKPVATKKLAVAR